VNKKRAPVGIMADKVDIDVRTIIEASAFGRFQWRVLTLCFAIALFDGSDAQIIGFVIGGMAHDKGIDRSAFGPLFESGFAGLLIGALIFGSAAERWGCKTVLIRATQKFDLFSQRRPRRYASGPAYKRLSRFPCGRSLSSARTP
jgi:MFS transporter, AAHS family, 4-hydroxybenzoate transporter